MIDISTLLLSGSLFNLSINDLISKLPSNATRLNFEEHKMKNGIVIYKCKSEDSDLEFASIQNAIINITIGFYETEKYKIQVGTTSYTITPNIELYAFLSILESLNVDWTIEMAGTRSKNLCLKLQSNVYCFFDLEIQHLLRISIDKNMFFR